jgi:hypothetical protein
MKIIVYGIWAANNARFDLKETFLFGGLSPPNKKIIPLHPRRLCGEISILDKSEFMERHLVMLNGSVATRHIFYGHATRTRSLLAYIPR